MPIRFWTFLAKDVFKVANALSFKGAETSLFVGCCLVIPSSHVATRHASWTWMHGCDVRIFGTQEFHLLLAKTISFEPPPYAHNAKGGGQ